MNDQTKSKLTAAQARQAYTTWYLQERADDLADPLDPIIFPEYFPGFPEYERYIPRALQGTDLELDVPEWPEPALGGETDTLRIFVRPKGSADWGAPTDIHPIDGPFVPGDFPYPTTVSAAAFVDEGTYELMYSVEIPSGDIAESLVEEFVIDKTPPNDGQSSIRPLEFEDQIAEDDGLTKEYLTSVSATGVPLIVPPYAGARNQDAIEVYVLLEEDIVPHKVFDDVIPNSRIVSIPVLFLMGKEDGLLAFIFKLKDIVGNTGPDSAPLETHLLLLPRPVGPFRPLRVPLAEDAKTLIDLADVRAGVRALVPRYTNHGKNDRIYLTWGTQTAGTPHRVGVNPTDPIIIDVSDTELIVPDYGGATGEKATAVTYQIQRGKLSYDADSPLNIKVDLSQLIDPSILPAVLVRGTGPAPENNKLLESDKGLNATATTTVPLGLVGVDWARLYWGDLPDYVSEVTPVPAEGDPLIFDVPWTEIEKVPGILVDVWYEVGVNGDNNPSPSPVTPVNVEEAVPIRLAVPEFLDARFVGTVWWVNCSSWIGPDANLRLHIPPNPKLSAGQQMSISVQGYSDFPPATTVGTAWTKTIPSLSQSQVDDGFTELVGPRASFFDDLLGRRGALKVDYTVVIGTSTLSGTLSIRANSKDAAGLCPINP
ncbi:MULTISPECIES: hypothetical protein [Pseudomonas]|uniref:hypothetical protein n=1 Tax=Pseudomonas TaxID=286 RepID=UPI00070A4BF8|nr:MULTISPECIES: hypothetical protein [Pseudomonas]KQW27119.1 hypothetical protein ASC85_27390 [Pseudomonas sp. Root401]WHS55913.1 hypothetical protein QLH64_08060 [Pseudomonas brassicacearum]